MNVDNVPPKVTIGLPVYNGERHVAEAIESILAQTYANFELIISDNASTDRTEEICRGYAESDPRVRYYRQPVNLGAAPNFNRLFELAEGSKYFKWAAHDDWIAPSYLRMCVGELENNPDAVLCQSLVEIVGEGGKRLDTYDHTASGANLARPSDRMRARLYGHCMGIFGVIRSDVLASTDLIGMHQLGDRTLLLELAMCGRSLLVPRRLFFNRDHSGRFSKFCNRVYTPQEELTWWLGQDPGGRFPCRTWTLYANCIRLVIRHVQNPAEKARCYGYLARSIIAHRWKWLALEPLMACSPRIFRVATRFRLRHQHLQRTCHLPKSPSPGSPI